MRDDDQADVHRGLAALVDAAHDLAVPTDLESLLPVVARQARRLLGLSLAFVGVLDDKQAALTIRAVDGLASGLAPGFRIPRDDGLAAAALAGPGPQWTADAADAFSETGPVCGAWDSPGGPGETTPGRPADTVGAAAATMPGWTAGTAEDRGDPLAGLVRAEGLRAVIAVRLGHGTGRFGKRPFGVLYAADRRARPFTADECALLGSLAELAGAAIEKARLFDRTVARLSGLENTTARTAADLGRVRELGAVHRALVDLAVSGDPQELVDEAGRRLGGAVRLYDADGRALATTRGPARTAWPDEDEPLCPDMPGPADREPVAIGPTTWRVPVVAGDRPLGTLLVRAGRVLSGVERQVLPLIAQAAAVVLRHHAGSAAEEHAREDLLDDLLVTPPRPRRRLDRAARRLGVDLDRPHVVLVARPEDGTAGTSRDPGQHRPGRPGIWAASYARRTGGLSGTPDGHLVLVLPGTDPGAAARTVTGELSSLLGTPVTIGAAGPVCGAAALAAGHREALRCLDALTALDLTGRGASGRELGFLGVLMSGRSGVDTFVDAVLGPVLDHDRRRFTDLTRTLDAYFEAGGSPTNAAERLHVHPNTVARRLERVKELLGPDWQRPVKALDVQLALRLFRLRDTLSGEPRGPRR
ncbi:helix-turn-helix domain-containing protein [Dactylosporangium sp. NPDC051484]|uniref:helix-turn-helix domain-containing protein n=1 Tax=Dactylosporangium sp. NPDC051484 TaxID=3154942 RepID=UPI00344D6D1B